jgi:hypothetical protein
MDEVGGGSTRLAMALGGGEDKHNYLGPQAEEEDYVDY